MPRSHWILLVATIAALAGGVGLALSHGNNEFLFYAATLVPIIAMVGWIDRRSGLPLWLLWALYAWIVLHLAGGTVKIPADMAEPPTIPSLYNLRLAPWFPKYDQLIHAYGFGVATLTSWCALAANVRSTGGRLLPTAGPLFAVCLMGMGLGAMNEMIEFTATRFFDTNVGGFENTGWDLISNFTGVVLAVIAIRLNPAMVEPKGNRAAVG